MLKVGREAGLFDNPEVDRSQLSIAFTSSDGRDHRFFLDNLFAETRDVAPEDRPGRILRFLRSAREFDAVPTDWAEVRDRLVPVIRAASAVRSDSELTSSPYRAGM